MPSAVFKNIIHRLPAILWLLTIVACPYSLFAQDAGNADDDDELSLSFDANVATPRVPQKQKSRVREQVADLEASLKDHGYAVVTLRDGEVLRVTIPCDRLFAPNSSELKDDVAPVLTPLKKYSRPDSPYKMVVAVHADDTGDTVYCDRLTADRASAIDGFFYVLAGGEETGIIPYGLGQDDFIGSNHSIEARARNRRVEIYLVPRTSLFQKQKK